MKDLSTQAREHRTQIIKYLKATGLQLRLLVNFGAHPKAVVERIVFGDRNGLRKAEEARKQCLGPYICLQNVIKD